MTDATPDVVVPLHGEIAVPGRAPKDVVEAIRDLLEEAQRGEIVGFAYAAVRPTGVPISSWTFQGAAHGFILIGAVARLLYRMNKGQDDD